jgi:hypothetical protein
METLQDGDKFEVILSIVSVYCLLSSIVTLLYGSETLVKKNKNTSIMFLDIIHRPLFI